MATHGDDWTPSEEQTLENNWNTHAAEEIADMLPGRTVDAVYSKHNRMKGTGGTSSNAIGERSLESFEHVKNVEQREGLATEEPDRSVTITTELYDELMEEWAVPHSERPNTKGYDYVTFSSSGNPELWGYDVPSSTWSSTDGSEGVTLKDHGVNRSNMDDVLDDIRSSAKRLET